MQNKPDTWNLGQLLGAQLGQAILIATPSVIRRATESLPFEQAEDFDRLPEGLDTLIVIGGGTLLDRSKVWRDRHAPGTRLIAIPSLWGSGAEVSPVAVLDNNGEKEILVGDEFIPDICCLWPELALTVPDRMARHACGDAWSHALEGFLSPLADKEVQEQLAEVIQEMVKLPLAGDPRWFELSARACAGQARSGVGLVHGIAHSLERYLRADFPEAGWGHAKLCSIFLWPVIDFNQQHSPKWERLTQQYELDDAAILDVLQDLHDADSYQQVLPLLDQHWMDILRDPCSRTNSALVRPASKMFFMEYAVQ
ncbi:iron-containing alcohol dehydrogenase [Pseudomonadota bacterium]